MTGTALITGAGRRIGRHLALALARAGWDVVVHYRASADEATEVVAAAEAAGRRAVAVHADLDDRAAVAGLIDQAQAAIAAPINLLVNNASVYHHDRFAGFDVEGWLRNHHVNLLVPVRLAQRFAAALPAGVEGAIVNLIDQKVMRLTPDYFSYTLSKAGLWTATQLLAMELGPAIRVNGIAPGLTLPSGPQSDADFQALHDKTPLGRGPTPDEIADALLFLVANPVITGQLLILDGGRFLFGAGRGSDLG